MYVFRAYFVLQKQGLSSPSGKPTHVLYGVLNMLRALRNQYPDSQVVMVFDGKGKGIRSEWYPEYKANRPPTPLDLVEQLPPLLEFIHALGVPLVQQNEWEADDIIGTLSRQALKSYDHIYIATRDKDISQLVTDKISLLVDEKTNEVWGPAEIKKKFGLMPAQIADYLALMGDKVDNIVGVDKVGAKTAAQLLGKYGSLKKLMQQAAAVPGKVGENLRAAEKRLVLNTRLTTIIQDVPDLPSLAALQQRAADNDKLRALCREYGLRSFMQEVEESTFSKQDYKLVTTTEEWESLMIMLKKHKQFAVDLATDEEDHLSAHIVGIAFSVVGHQAYYAPCGHSSLDAPQQLPLTKLLADLLPLFNDKKERKVIVSRDMKYLLHILINQLEKETTEWDTIQAQLPVLWEDIMLISYCLNSIAHHDIEALGQQHLGITKKNAEDVLGKGQKKVGFDQVAAATVCEFIAQGADMTYQLYDLLHKDLRRDKKLMAVYTKIEQPLLPILLKMERNGALVDSNALKAQSKSLGEKMAAIAEKIFVHASHSFNLNSPAQLNKVLYEEMGFEITKKTAGGKPSTSEDALQELALQHEMPKLILAYRGLSKLKNTYTDPLQILVNPHTKRIHTSFHQEVASTGRLSSMNPNLQNIPIRTAEGRRIRQAFIAPPGRVLASADYSQIELRIMAHLSNDETLLQAFHNNQDIHQVTAAEVFGVAAQEVDAEQRRRAKAVNFGLIYGMSAFGLAKQLNIEQVEAQKFIRIYFERYPGVLEYMKRIRQLAAKRGWVETLCGRRVYTREINSANFVARQAAERTAINAPVQGTAADIIKLAMLRVDEVLDHRRATLLLQVHDELVFEVDEDYVEECRQLVCANMAEVTLFNEQLKVPLAMDFDYGTHWDEAH